MWRLFKLRPNNAIKVYLSPTSVISAEARMDKHTACTGRKSKMANENDNFPLHKAVFDNDLKCLSRLLRKHNVAAKDMHGKLIRFEFSPRRTLRVTFVVFRLCLCNCWVCFVVLGNTALHLAVMLGRKGKLLRHGDYHGNVFITRRVVLLQNVCNCC